jgi:hypothetical protein
MHYDMRPDRLGWTLFDVTTGRPVVWDDVPLTGVDLDAAHELLVLLHRRRRAHAARTDAGSSPLSADADQLRTARRFLQDAGREGDQEVAARPS